MIRTIFILLLTPLLSYGFTLNPNTGKGFNKNEISIEVASTSCAGAGISTSKFRSLIKKAVETYWNSVPTSAIYLKVKSVGTKDVDGLQFDDALDLASSNTILAGCNDDATEFSEEGILGAAVMDCNGDTCKSTFLLNAAATSSLPELSESTVIATIAHEIGHAIGIGHSEFKHNLMYYSASGKKQKWLGEDDIDAVNYLYPHDSKIVGLLGSCGTISTDIDNNFPSGGFFLLTILGLLLSLALGKLIRPNSEIDYGLSR